MATDIYCYACRGFFDIKERGCPDCGAPRRARNSYLETAKLNNHLYAQAEVVEKRRKAENHLARTGEDPRGPSPWAKQIAQNTIDQM